MATPAADNDTQEAVARHREQQRKMETIVRESRPVDLGDDVVRASASNKYEGLENLDVGSKFKMFEQGGGGESDERLSSDRYGIMEKLKRLQEGEDLDDLLKEIDDELPNNGQSVDADAENVEDKKKLFDEGGQERRDKLAAERRKELKDLREKLMAGTRDAVLDQFEDVLNASANRVKKTKVDVRSENAKRFRDMFDKGEVPEAGPQTIASSATGAEKAIMEKEHELEQMRKQKRQQKEFFRKMEAGEFAEEGEPKEPKLLVGKIKTTGVESGKAGEDLGEEMPELASLSNRFSFFEHFEEKATEQNQKRKQRGNHAQSVADKECKARSVLSKFKEMEQRVLNGEEDRKYCTVILHVNPKLAHRLTPTVSNTYVRAMSI